MSLPEPIDRKVLTQLHELQAESPPGEPHIVLLLLDIFLEDTPRTLEQLRHAIAARDGALLNRIAHQFKGTSATVGALLLSSYCEALEQCANEGQLERAAHWLQQIEKEYERVRQAMEEEKARIQS